MKNEFSCGSVVYKLENGIYKFLLIKHKNGGHISFPKGHMENDETEIVTVKREVYEETGILIKIDETKYKDISYSPKEGIMKKVTFFLSEAVTSDSKNQEEEVSEIYWEKSDKVLDMLTYETDSEIFLELTKDLKKSKTKSILELIGIMLFTIILVGLTDFLNWCYWYKAAFKLIMFLGIPYAYLKVRVLDIKKIFRLDKKNTYISIVLGIVVYGFVLGGYFVIRNWMDFSTIPEALEKNLGITESNFMTVFFYIPIVNALLEELFFRGFLQEGFKKFFKTKYAIIISAFIFSIYHLAIIGTWVSVWPILAALASLMIVGMVFGYITEKTKSILPTYMIHLFANLAINTAALFILHII
ncbi:predicted NUDIX hydrolase [Alteracholeplasma palmae J233]|uniref:Bis(5'-nucleosyl)-tetraphosphatase [asymmetrical] n=1 Tax=Alteracholeplasma palmae (strain ATCC 49389 / J233) TaxID=1318466 RepID=U4KRQ4_ALTPJ|nr:CPBP family glutamic-type intramembrane protease [Alteracholeplasma palmae]CCV64371.1 predicted NUDIX hydrolase [Alteracholeplasma palmae J233]